MSMVYLAVSFASGRSLTCHDGSETLALRFNLGSSGLFEERSIAYEAVEKVIGKSPGFAGSTEKTFVAQSPTRNKVYVAEMS